MSDLSETIYIFFITWQIAAMLANRLGVLVPGSMWIRDFEVPGVSNLEVAGWIAGNLDFDQLILEHYEGGNTGWIHCSYKGQNNRKEVLTYDRKNGYRKGLIT